MLPTENVHCAYISKAHVFSFRWRCRFKTKNYTMDIIPFSKIRLVCPNPTTVATLTHYYPAEEEMYENVWDRRQKFLRCVQCRREKPREQDYLPLQQTIRVKLPVHCVSNVLRNRKRIGVYTREDLLLYL